MTIHHAIHPMTDPSRVLPLETGDRLTRAEFERRYLAMPDLKKAELIEGVVYVGSPVRATQHGAPHAWIIGWLAGYCARTPQVQCCVNATLRLDEDNEPQPDVLLRLTEPAGGRSRLDADGYVSGAPELIAEIAASSSSIDLHKKLHVYRRHGVREYVVLRTLDGMLDWFEANEGRFERRAPDTDGILRSRVFPGLWLDVPATLRGDGATLLGVLERGCRSEEHARFAARPS
jgi:Uma2 family endonuclease